MTARATWQFVRTCAQAREEAEPDREETDPGRQDVYKNFLLVVYHNFCAVIDIAVAGMNKLRRDAEIEEIKRS